ncbi:hypothetical protein B0T19DRAFT_463909 [Cercophora scortea]|uniref:Uncharacterized protein n=1 Tax=Cercophora scortea TaxID=314031 RepID=A0AAE0IF81_9PEZI|nr:hypothetical protein B0T19DRAFT_463909 [Cercophora scortea]
MPSSKSHPEAGSSGFMTAGGMSSSTKTPANAHVGHHERNKVFDAHGAIGKQFTEKGAIGGTAQAIGGPLAKDGMIGKQFTEDGKIGGAVQGMMGGKTKTSY